MLFLSSSSKRSYLFLFFSLSSSLNEIHYDNLHHIVFFFSLKKLRRNIVCKYFTLESLFFSLFLDPQRRRNILHDWLEEEAQKEEGQ